MKNRVVDERGRIIHKHPKQSRGLWPIVVIPPLIVVGAVLFYQHTYGPHPVDASVSQKTAANGASHTKSYTAESTMPVEAAANKPTGDSAQTMQLRKLRSRKPIEAAANIVTPTRASAQTISAHTAVGKTFNWHDPSGGPYPDLSKYTAVWIDVSLSDQRVRVMSGNKVIYTMITSSGLPGPDTYTPTGTFHIQNRGTWFYNQSVQEGAEYWVSWKGWGEYLFHTVPMNSNKQVLPEHAANLGIPDSHGCLHLTISDAKWIYEHIPQGTKVVIHN